MRKGRPLAPLSISREDRTQLVAWCKRPKTAQALAMRSRIVLLAGDGLSNTAIARQLHTMQHTVGKWRRRYSESGLDGLLDEPRPGTSRKLGDADVERVLTLTLESTPQDATHWSTRSMAKRVGLSRNSIQRIWQAFSLAPHRSETFKLSRDPLFIDKVRDIVGLYLAPQNVHWSYVLMKKARFKPWTEPHRCYRCVRDRSSAAATIMPVMEPPRCLPRLMPRAGS